MEAISTSLDSNDSPRRAVTAWSVSSCDVMANFLSTLVLGDTIALESASSLIFTSSLTFVSCSDLTGLSSAMTRPPGLDIGSSSSCFLCSVGLWRGLFISTSELSNDFLGVTGRAAGSALIAVSLNVTLLRGERILAAVAAAVAAAEGDGMELEER